MIKTADRVKFAEKNVVTPDGQPFSVEGREWIVKEFWEPLNSFKLWLVDTKRACDSCRSRAQTLTQGWHDADDTRTDEHAAANDGCAGLTCNPILAVFLKLGRQRGKTTATSAYALSEIFLGENEEIAFAASSEKQAGKLFREHYRLPVETSPLLSKLSDPNAPVNEIFVPSKNSRFKYLTSSHANIVSATNTKLILDECRDVEARTFAAGWPTLFARGGWYCERFPKHMRTHRGVHTPDAPKRCVVCGGSVAPWFSKGIFMSSANVLDGTDADWFEHVVADLIDNPDPNIHVYSDPNAPNPKIATEMVEAQRRLFSRIPILAALGDVEVNNQARFKGEDFVSKDLVNRTIDKSLRNAEVGLRPCVGFLDTSKTKELTSLVIVEDCPPPAWAGLTPEETAALPTWSYVRVARIDKWWPHEQPTKSIDENTVLPTLDLIAPCFPWATITVDGKPFRALRVDTRISPWGVRLVHLVRDNGPTARPWGKHVDGVNSWKDAERDAAWEIYLGRIEAGTILHPEDEDLRKELEQARNVDRGYGRTSVRDASRKKRHIDIAECVAACCYLIQTIQMHKRGMTLAQMRTSMAADPITAIRRAPRPVAARFGPNGY